MDDDVLQVHIAGSSIDVRQGEARGPAAVLHTDIPTYLGLLNGQVDLNAALSSGAAQLEGDANALRRFLRICGLPAASGPA